MDFDAGHFQAEFQTADGQKLWSLLSREDVVAQMMTASDLGHPALAPVEDTLLQELGPIIMFDRFKQMAGRMTKQIMESHGFVHEASDIRLNSVPFYKASRYRRRDASGVYVFRNSSNPREICLTGARNSNNMPPVENGHWTFVNYLTSPIKASIGYGFNLASAVAHVKEHGYLRHDAQRITRRG